MRYDIAIIGAGPAGISAAITAKVRNKNIVLIDKKNVSEKVTKAHEICNYPGLIDVAGADLAAAYEKQLASMQISRIYKQVSQIYAMGDYYAIQLEGDMLEATTVILATGMTVGKMLPGEAEFLGRGVSYCATCDGQFYRGKNIAVVGETTEAREEVRYLAEMAESVWYFPEYADEHVFDDMEHVHVCQEKATGIEGGMKANRLVTEDKTYEVDGIFLLREHIAASQLVPGLAMENQSIAVNLQMETNLPGCFACGDVAGKPYQYIKAAGQGNVAALSAVSYLNKK